MIVCHSHLVFKNKKQKKTTNNKSLNCCLSVSPSSCMQLQLKTVSCTAHCDNYRGIWLRYKPCRSGLRIKIKPSAGSVQSILESVAKLLKIQAPQPGSSGRIAERCPGEHYQQRRANRWISLALAPHKQDVTALCVCRQVQSQVNKPSHSHLYHTGSFY